MASHSNSRERSRSRSEHRGDRVEPVREGLIERLAANAAAAAQIAVHAATLAQASQAASAAEASCVAILAEIRAARDGVATIDDDCDPDDIPGADDSPPQINFQETDHDNAKWLQTAAAILEWSRRQRWFVNDRCELCDELATDAHLMSQDHHLKAVQCAEAQSEAHRYIRV